jgi:hypothetical protein
MKPLAVPIEKSGIKIDEKKETTTEIKILFFIFFHCCNV